MQDRGKRNRKRIFPDERRRWLDKYEGGKSQSALAKETGRNIRTITTHVQRASDERERAMARTDLYRQAFTKHNKDLLAALEGARQSLVVPHAELLTVLVHFPWDKAYMLPAGLEFQDGVLSLASVRSDEDQIRILELAREHLRRDKELWNGLDEWWSMLKEYADECFELGRRVGAKASEKLAVELTSREGSATGLEEGLHEGFVSWPCRLSIEAASGKVTNDHIDKLQLTDSQLRYGGDTIATLSSPEKRDAARAYFLELITTLPQDPSVRKVARLKRQLDSDARRLRRLIGDALLMGFVPGRCSVCKRVGL